MMDIGQFLIQNGIEYERFDHPAVFTCEESDKLPPMPGAQTKNLVLSEEKGPRLFLVTVGHDKRVDLKALRNILGSSALRFASEEILQKYLGVTPGSATILGLMHDTDHAVTCVIDEELWKADALQCHPLMNTATLVIPHAGIEKFLSVTGHAPRVFEVPAKVTD